MRSTFYLQREAQKNPYVTSRDSPLATGRPPAARLFRDKECAMQFPMLTYREYEFFPDNVAWMSQLSKFMFRLLHG